MGRDKALLAHPRGGTWLEGSLGLLAGVGVPITLLSGHDAHLVRAELLAPALPVPLLALREPPPREGPLAALLRLMTHHPGERLLLCAVDMPWLTPAALRRLVAAAAVAPQRVHVGHDSERLHPLPGLYPADRHHREALVRFHAIGGRALRGWLAEVGATAVPLPATALRNVNAPADWPGSGPAAAAAARPG
jgi:molybdopterin-guanine dinucleotide biosynthesis protein A